MAPPAAPLDPLDWRPQVPLKTRVPVTIRDAIVEPLWSGTRVLAHVDTQASDGVPTVLFVDGGGLDLAPAEPTLAATVGASLLALDAVLDGVLTFEATRDGAGVAIVTQARMSVMDNMFSRDPGIEVRPPARGEAIGEEAFVALDLLRLDGQSLLDVPLLERKRLLESVVSQGPLVRVSLVCRPPVDSWVASWQAVGLRGAMMKSANGRYVPGDRTPEWRAVTRVGGRR